MHISRGLNPTEIFEQRVQSQWIIGRSQGEWINRIEQYREALTNWHQSHGCPRVLVLQTDPWELLACFMACAIAQCPLFLGNPNWKQQELAQAQAIANPHIIWSDQGTEYFAQPPVNTEEIGWMMIPTGGTSGQIKFSIHTWSTLSAAVVGMQAFFFPDAPQPIHSCCVLPMYHVSGLMQFMRSLLTGGELIIMPFKTLMQGDSANESIQQFLSPNSQTHQTFFISLVPTQLSRLIQTAQTEKPTRLQWLRQFQTILLGGAPASLSLLTQARQLQLRLAPCYGMTETAAQVMTLHPKDFLAGMQPPGYILPHVTLQLVGSSPHTNSGQLQWSGPSIHRGYYPQEVKSDRFHFLSDDIAEMKQDGSLLLKGRASRKILSGGENIYPEEIEAVLMAMSEIKDVCVFGMPDDDWGEIAIAAYIPVKKPLSEESLRHTVKASLASYKCPKIWWPCDEIPRNAQGKVSLQQLKNSWKSDHSFE